MTHVTIIAEAGVNHNGSVEMAKQLIDKAVEAGADYIKFQTFKAEKLVSKSARQAEYQKRNIGASSDDSQLSMLKKLELSKADHEELISYCRQKGIKFFSTAFDMDSIDYLHSLHLGLWKIPSGEITNYPYLKKIAQYREPVILSTGMCEIDDVREAMNVLLKFGVKPEQITILHCNTEYPTPYADVNLRAMQQLRDMFHVEVGYSDHTKGIEVPIAAVALGASVIEKHFTLDRSLPGPDHKASLEPEELKAMVSAIRHIESALGDGHKHVSDSERKNIAIARKSIVAVCPIRKGDVLTEQNLTVKRPGTGISPMRWEDVVGTKAIKDFSEEDLIEIEFSTFMFQFVKRKICVVTGSRAEYGILRTLMQAIKEDSDLELQVVATNQHLSKLQGETYKEIERDGFTIYYKVYMADDEAPDNANTTAKAIGRGISGFADAFDVLKPDLLLILGDRYEMLAVASAALIYKIPIAHLHGGEITEGAFDDAIRHAITKMSHLHFTSTEVYRQRVIQLGEQPDRVFNVGALGVENVMKTALMSKEELEDSLHFKLTSRCILCTYHPVTLSLMSSEQQVLHLLRALDKFKDYHIIFTYSNSDTDSQIIIQRIQEYVDKNPDRCMFIPSLGQRRYFSALKHMKAVIGNSSSGIIEVPSFGIPTLDIGDRQKGRIAAESVIHCGYSQSEIEQGIEKLISFDAKSVSNPYYKEGTCEAILKVIKNYPLDGIIQKQFYDLR